MHDSFTALGGMVPLINMQLGEIIVGGVGAGMYGMLLFVIIADVRRRTDGRPHAGICRQEDRGQGSQDGDARHPDSAAYVSSAGPPLQRSIRRPLHELANAGPHGFSEMLYLYTSSTGNNGSAFAGITANTPVLQHHRRGRDVCRPLLDDHSGDGDCRLACGEESRCRRPLARSRRPAACLSACVVGVILIVGGLTFFPALALGPIVEQLAMTRGHTFLNRILWS